MQNDILSQTAFDGELAKLVTLRNGKGMSITLMDIGATWLSCQLPLPSNEQREVLLGVGDMVQFAHQRAYLGSTVGRYANRIAAGRFEIDGVTYQVQQNQAGNCLHGGDEGFDRRRWQIEQRSEQRVRFSLVSPDGDQGFPGNLTVSVQYTLTDECGVHIEYLANTDKATPINLTNHAYFNLHGADAQHHCLAHQLQINAAEFVPTRDDGIPLGKFKAVKGTGFDFNLLKTIGQDHLSDPEQLSAKGYDHSFVFATERDVTQAVAKVISPDQAVSMAVFTDKPAMQLYTGNWLAGTPDRVGGEYCDYAGLALETQLLPDAPNHPEWTQPNPILYPEDTYHYFTLYQFYF